MKMASIPKTFSSSSSHCCKLCQNRFLAQDTNDRLYCSIECYHLGDEIQSFWDQNNLHMKTPNCPNFCDCKALFWKFIQKKFCNGQLKDNALRIKKPIKDFFNWYILMAAGFDTESYSSCGSN
ncbi:uncharacterized protein LOC131049075 [Cryptomeria japonica]|uniref:uncharacterized protein LOC131049075 n=1 Tax=Cryptomeria japonica TaxID=3369 RepID=UPI0027DAA332|nr:uncharacterized protein LOC131049075 [Cryptomeria japonica]